MKWSGWRGCCMNDQRTLWLVIGLLGVIALVCIGVIAWRPSQDVSGIAGAAVGALASMLVSARPEGAKGGGQS